MLVLTRRTNESVDLIDSLSGVRLATITVTGISANGVVRLGFDCPDYIYIERDDIKNKNKSSGGI
jgi:carbon storage regulator CsrA